MVTVTGNPELEHLVRTYEAATGESVETLLTDTLKNRVPTLMPGLTDSPPPLDKRPLTPSEKRRYESIMEIARECHKLPVLDNRTPDEIIGYDENGLPYL